MRKALVGVLLCLGLVAGCKAEPTYQGVSVVTYNYTPWDLTSVRIADAFGGVAGSGMIRSGGGEGSVSCCYTLKGTDFTVKWKGGDADLMRKHMFDGKFDEVIFAKETTVHLPSQDAPPGDGPVILELHIYPDELMELALSRQLLGQVRIPIPDTTRWLYEHHRKELAGYEDIHELRYVLAKVAKQAWVRYRIQDAEDMRGYMYLYFVVASDFDTDPDITALLKDPNRKPGDFGRAVFKLSKDRLAQIKAAGTAPGDKNV
ncbi:DUF3304 domain-containing protein [Achromobacter sp. NFACC18-2]|uniref:DUF3304 domain-containing protein n=1 Tax=Achromobacter sp. NFACC18-2 TaxID=1564112 RepID=UPI0008C27513|nr:DUF3304 domain-containing protein [Achromobacter sp. NFACC18-2]SEJ83945.1 Protein of unknown function [Achromobacter sp. NFACC18-2]